MAHSGLFFSFCAISIPMSIKKRPYTKCKVVWMGATLFEFGHYLLQLLTYAVVAEVAYAAFVGVVHLASGSVCVILHLHAHLAVGLAEGNA